MEKRFLNLNYKPQTLNEKDLTVDFVLSTDEPVKMIDFEEWRLVDEILVPTGVFIDNNNQVPLVDSHNTNSTKNVYGAVRNVRVEPIGVVGTLHFDENDPEAVRAFNKIKSGYITDGSVGYENLVVHKLREGEKITIGEKTYTGEANVVEQWRLLEFSIVPIGADKFAKARSKKGVKSMSETKITLEELEKAKREAAEKAKKEALAAAKREADELAQKEREASKKMYATITKEARALKLNDEQIDELLTIDDLTEARAKMIEFAAQRTTAIEPKKVEITQDEQTKFVRAATDGILLRAGVPVQKPAEGAQSLRLSFHSLARECLERAGISTRRMSSTEILERAINQRDFPIGSTSTFNFILKDAANKSLLAGWEAMPVTYPAYCKMGTVNDFKVHNRVRLSDAPEMDKINELGELPTKAFKDTGATVQADEHGLVINISRKVLINDDLNVLNDIPMAIGGRARQQVNAFAINLLTNNQLSDGSVCFSAANGNLSGTAGQAPSSSSFREMRIAMRKQTDINGTKLNISPAYILVGAENEDALLVLLTSQVMKGATDEPNNNIYRNSAQPLVDANVPNGDWYGIANKIFPTIEIVTLNGRETPQIEELPQSEILGIRLRAVFDFGGSILDYRGLYKFPGA